MDKVTIMPYTSPAGQLIIGSYSDRICLCDWVNRRIRDKNENLICRRLHYEYVEGCTDIIENTISQLNEYFSHKRIEFNIPLFFTGTDFQKSVWEALSDIPYGVTVTYSDIARSIGNPKGVRAVASAISSNPISILVPCHRVIGSNGQLTGYRGGIEAKQILLNIEKES